ncbi:MAG: flagellar biosynthetic protein FliO [Bacillota bacterium]
MNDFWAAFLRLLIALPLTLLLAYGALKFALPRRFPLASGRRMRLVEQLPLGPKAGLWLVQVGEKYYLLAQGEGGVAVVREYDALPEAIAATPAPGRAGFSGWREFLGGGLTAGAGPFRRAWAGRREKKAGTGEAGPHGR